VGFELSHSVTFTNNVNGLNASGQAVGSYGAPLNAAGYATEGAASYAGNIEAGKLLNQPEHFSWAGLVASSVGAVVGGELGGQPKAQGNAGIYSDDYLRGIGAHAAEDVTTREVSVGLGDHHVQSWAQLAEDVAGNAIGQPIGRTALSAYQAYRSKQELAKINASESTLLNNGHAAFNDPLNPQALDFSHVDPQAALELQEELAAEEMSHLGTSIGSDAPSYDVSTAPVAGETDLSSGAHGRLASTTIYSGTYVDPYLVRRNGGQADWSNTVQTFELPDQAPALFVDTTPAQPAAAPPSGLQAELVAARIGGAELGIVAASVKAVVGLAVTAKTIAGAAGDELFGGYTNAFRADADRLGGMVDAGVHFVENHPIDTTLASLKSTLDQAGELSQSSNPLDQLKAGMLIGETTTNVGLAVDGAAGLGRLGVDSAGLLANGAGRLADAVGELKFAGSGSGYGGLAPSSELGAIGEDLSGFRPGASIDVGTATDVAAIEPDVVNVSLTARDVVQQAVLGDVSDSATLSQFNTAHDFYANAGYEGERLIGHLQGIDYTQPVDLTQLESGTTYVQHVLDGTKGNYFAELGTPAETLGVNPAGRVPLQFTPAESVAALRSTAAKITDTWTVRGTPFEAQGGGTQLFVPNKGAMIEVPSNALQGPVVFRAPPRATPEEIAQVQAYVNGSNEALEAGALSPTGRVSTAGGLRIDASAAAVEERARALAEGMPYQGHVGHVPDTTWTGNPQPYSWLDLSLRVNSSLGGQATRYPVGYQPTEFIFEGLEQ
jgi:hypothetical protein